MVLDCGNRLRGHFTLVPEALDPRNLRFAPEPRHLPLGIIAMGLLHRVDRGFAVYFALE
jgi:hypothetical protein